MDDAADRAPRIVVYGSCVGRDTIEAVRDRVDLLDYVARQSLLSSDSDASAHLPAELGLDSVFQARMVEADFAGGLQSELAERAEQIDLLLWDLVDERHGVHRFADGTIVTRSIDTIRSPVVSEVLADAEHLAFGDPEHFRLWRRQARRFVDRLRELGLLERTVVLEVPWALQTVQGEPSPWSMGVRAKDANVTFHRYYALLRRLGVPVLSVRDADVLADPDHRWGLAPFHYTPAVYREILGRLQSDHGVANLVVD